MRSRVCKVACVKRENVFRNLQNILILIVSAFIQLTSFLIFELALMLSLLFLPMALNCECSYNYNYLNCDFSYKYNYLNCDC